MLRASANSSSRRLLGLFGAALLLALVLLAKYGRNPDTASLQIIGHALVAPAGMDSSLYMNMGEDAFRAPGHRIFPSLFFAQHQKFIYPPSSLFLIEALNLAPSPSVALKILLLLSWLGTLTAAVLFFDNLRGGVTVLEAAAVGLLACIFLPIAEALYRGQVQMLLTFLWGLAALLWQRERRGWAGFVLALTCAFKPQLALFLLWGALRKEWRFTGVLTGTLAVISACSIAHFGLQNNLDYLPMLAYLSRHGEALWANQSLNGLLNRILRNGDAVGWNPLLYPPYRASVYVLSSAFTLIFVLFGLLLPRVKNWAGSTADFLFFGGITVVVSPIAWEHHYAIFFFPLVFLLARAEGMTRPRWLLLAACLLAMANRLPPLDHRIYGAAAIFGSYLFYAGLVVLWLLAIEAEKSPAGSNPSAILENVVQ